MGTYFSRQRSIPEYRARFKFEDLTERYARDGELVVKVMEESRGREREAASVSIPLDKFVDGGVERKTFKMQVIECDSRSW